MAGNNNRDVQLIIKAKNEASQQLDAITKSLNALEQVQKSVATSSDKTSSSLGDKLAKSIGTLKAQMSGFESFSKIADQISKADEAANKISSSFVETKTKLMSFETEAAKTEAQIKELGDAQESLVAVEKQATAQLAVSKAARREATTELNNATRALEKYQQKASAGKNVDAAKLTTAVLRVDSATTTKSVADQNYTQLAVAAAAASAAVNENRNTLAVAEQQQSATVKQVLRLNSSLENLTTAETKAKVELTSLTEIASKASGLLGGVAAKEDEIAAAAKNAAAQTDRLVAAQKRLNEAGNTKLSTTSASPLANYKGQIYQVSQARTAFEEARKQATALGQAIASTDSPTTTMVRDFEIAQATLKAARIEMIALNAELNKLRSNSAKQSSFVEFAKVQEQISAQSNLNTIASNSTRPSNANKGAAASSVESSKAIAQYAALTAQVKAARSEWEKAKATATELGRSLSGMTNPTQQMVTSFEQARQKVKETETNMRALSAQLSAFRGVSGGSFKSFIQEIAPLPSKLDEVKTKVTQADAALAKSNGGREALSLFQRLRGEVLSLAASFVGLYGVINGLGEVIATIRTTDSARSQLLAAYGGDSAQVGKEIQFLRSESDRLGLSFGSLSQQYGKLAIAGNQAGISSETQRKIFLALSEAGRSAHLSADNITRSFVALTQMISKGKIQSEELRGQLGDSLPGAFNILAKSLGVTSAQLEKMLQDGKVLANDDTISKFATGLTDAYGAGLQSALSSTTFQIDAFFNNLFKAQEQVANGGFEEALGKNLAQLNEYFKSRDGVEFFTGLGAAAGRFTDILAPLAKNIEYVIAALGAWAAMKLAPLLLVNTAALSGFRASLINTAASASNVRWATTWARAVDSIKIAYANATAAVRNFGAASVASTTAAATASTSIRVIDGALIGLTATLRVTALGVKTLFAAFGGWPTLVMAGITYALGTWLTSVEETTDAVAQHKAAMDKVAETYENAKAQAISFKDAVKGGLLEDLEKGFIDTKKQASDLNSELLSLAKAVGRGQKDDSFLSTFSDAMGQQALSEAGVDPSSLLTKDQKALNTLTESYERGSISVGKYLEQLRELNKNSENADFKESIRLVIEKASKTDTLRKIESDYAVAAKESGSRLKELNDAADKSGKTIASLTEIQQKNAAQLKSENIQTLDAYAKSLNDLKGKIPSLKNEMKGMKLSEEFDEAAKSVKGLIDKLESLGQVAPQKIAQMRDELNKSIDQGKLDIQINQDKEVFKGLTDRFILAESGGRTGAKTTKTGQTASGLGGFTDSTFIEQFKKVFPDQSKLDNSTILSFKDKEDIVRALINSLMGDNAKSLRSAGNEVDSTNLYLGHFLGASGANRLLSGYKSDPTAPATSAVNDESLKNNKEIFYNADGTSKTLQEIYDWAAKKASVDEDDLKLNRAVNKELQKQQKDAEEFNDKLTTRLKNESLSLNKKKDISKEDAVALRLQKEINDAAKEHRTLSEDQKKLIVENASRQYDQVTALEQQRDKYKEIKSQVALIPTLEENVDFFKNQGDTSSAATAQKQITDIKASALEAIPTLEAFWKSVGGEEGATMVNQLEKVRLTLTKTTDSTSDLNTGVADVRKNLAMTFAEGMTNAFSTTIENITNAALGFESWSDAIQNAGLAFAQFAASFLLEIAQMIIKAEILKALGLDSSGNTSGGGSDTGGGSTISGLMSFASLLFHEGGVVGRSGGMTRSVSPMIFAGAPRFHSGGLPGLKSNETPIIAKKNEEVLSESDPRNVLNGGKSGQSASGGMAAIRNIVVFSDKEVTGAMSGSSGEQVTLTHVKKNAQTIRQILKI